MRLQIGRKPENGLSVVLGDRPRHASKLPSAVREQVAAWTLRRYGVPSGRARYGLPSVSTFLWGSCAALSVKRRKPALWHRTSDGRDESHLSLSETCFLLLDLFTRRCALPLRSLFPSLFYVRASRHARDQPNRPGLGGDHSVSTARSGPLPKLYWTVTFWRCGDFYYVDFWK